MRTASSGCWTDRSPATKRSRKRPKPTSRYEVRGTKYDSDEPRGKLSESYLIPRTSYLAFLHASSGVQTGEKDPPIRIGISSCLLGEKVRYDGGDKLDRLITEDLGRLFEWVPVCPEVEAGFGIPREPMRLERRGHALKLVTVTTRAELTPAMRQYASARVAGLARENLSGYLFKSKSPSCGLVNVPVHGTRKSGGRGERLGAPVRNGTGLFAEAVRARFPNLPMEEEGRLSDPAIRENWIQRVFCYYRLNRLWNSRWTLKSLQAFHAEHESILRAHSRRACLALGRMIAGAQRISRGQLKSRYESEFMRILKVRKNRTPNQ